MTHHSDVLDGDLTLQGHQGEDGGGEEEMEGRHGGPHVRLCRTSCSTLGAQTSREIRRRQPFKVHFSCDGYLKKMYKLFILFLIITIQ